MPEHAYRCVCGEKIHVFFDRSQYPFPESYPCKCGRSLVRFFEGAPSMQPDIWNPYYDHQLGAMVTSRSERDRIAKEKGLVIMGKEEFKRSQDAHHEKDEFAFSPQEQKLYRESAEKAYNDLKYGNVPVPEMPTVDAAAAAVVEST